MPITGIPLPLMSYGGSSVIATFLALGLLQSIYVQGARRLRRSRAASLSSLKRRTHYVKKQVLVSVDPGRPASRCWRRPDSPAAEPRAAGARRKKTRPPGYRVAELYLERRGSRSIVGNIYKGRVDNVLAGLEAAFVDIGLEKNGFLHVDEIVLPGVEIAAPRPRQGRAARRSPTCSSPARRSSSRSSRTRSRPRARGCRWSSRSPAATWSTRRPARASASRKRLDDKERERLRKRGQGPRPRAAAARSSAPPRTAPSARTSSASCSTCSSSTRCSSKRVEEPPAPAMVFQEADLSVRVVRDIFSDRLRARDRRRREAAPAPRLVLHAHRARAGRPRRAATRTTKPLFEDYGVEEVIDGLHLAPRRPAQRRLPDDRLRRGADGHRRQLRLVRRPRQAGARSRTRSRKTNLEAAEEVVRQLRLRDIGGIIVIDFIDMARARNRDAVLKTLRKALDEDRTKTFTAEISQARPRRDDAPERHRGRARDHDPRRARPATARA